MASATSPLVSRGFCLILSLLLLRVGLVSTSPTPSFGHDRNVIPFSEDALSKRAGPKFRSFSPQWRGRIEKGKYLLSLFPVSNEEAQQLNDGNPVASEWQDPEAAARWGWTSDIKLAPFPTTSTVQYDENLPSFRNSLNIPFADEDHFVDPSENALCLSKHNQGFELEGGGNGEPTNAVYKNVYNPSSGAIVFDSNLSPEYQKNRYKKGDVPKLEHLSDLAYFQWVKTCKEKNVHPSNIRAIFVAHITHPATFTIVKQAVMGEGKAKIPLWDRRLTFPMDKRPGQAILGTTWGAGAALFLIQHKEALGLKRIKDVTVWCFREDDDAPDDSLNTHLFLRFTVVST
ncbi:hypothetical protein C8034_v002642 [Colletotrichum sidae]|uniref:Uncharacterized protein n=1 Tax=Colletotrichum sidae TaxID=1347389 RepID=A0A4R8TAT3_9PEZI|nr:hypothetical protein C8034_v002642 [Colletotrichum sidae]